ncbi:MAG: O-acetyl-ADP-ribose deacetylase [Sedimentisphaeraceae bacterium JB056]
MRVIKGDITKLQVDAIVNAANRTLLGGGGVDGAIHRAAGPKLLEDCRKLGGCHTGGAKITPAFSLPSRYIIHTVGPVYYGGSMNEKELLADCYRNSLRLAQQNDLRSIAFPCISTGAYRYPSREAAQIAIATVSAYCADIGFQPDVIFCCFSNSDEEIYLSLLASEPVY